MGIRNSLIKNFNFLDLRTDRGALWENFCVVERIKVNFFRQRFVNNYFWRNYNGQEIDYLEERNGLLNAFEFKYSAKKKVKPPQAFLDTYPKSSFKVINRENLNELFLDKK